MRLFRGLHSTSLVAQPRPGIAVILVVTALLGAASLAFGTNSDAVDATELNAR